jgi:hypothetical protein
MILARRDYDGRRPCIHPLTLGRLVERLVPIKLRIRTERLNWQDIDDLSNRSIKEAAK